MTAPNCKVPLIAWRSENLNCWLSKYGPKDANNVVRKVPGWGGKRRTSKRRTNKRMTRKRA